MAGVRRLLALLVAKQRQLRALAASATARRSSSTPADVTRFLQLSTINTAIPRADARGDER